MPAAYLAEFEANAAAKESEVTIQKLFSEPKRVVEKYAVGDGGDLKKKHMVCLNWVLSDTPLDPETELALGFLDHLMLGTPGSPLTKVLLESGLGEAIVGGGIEDELRQPQFSIGLKGVAADDVSRVEDLVFSTLKQLIEDGFSSEAVEASMNTIEFSLRENNTGSFPRGLSLMLRSMVSGESEFERTRWCLEVFFSETVICCVHFFSPGLVSPLSSDHFSD
jgi:Zn-dependent M16 (insulinase) family peptidase